MDENLAKALEAIMLMLQRLTAGNADTQPSARLDNQVVDSVSATNFKVIADGPAVNTNALFSNMISHGHRVDGILEGQLGAICNKMVALDPMEARSASQMFPDQMMSSLGAAIAAIQQYTKSAQSTPPETAAGT